MKTGKVDMAKVQEELRKAQVKADKRGVLWWKPKDGTNLIRFLPPWNDAGLFAKEAGYHYNVAQNTSIACPKVCKGAPCPVCETANELFRSRRPESIEQARRIAVKTRYFANILDRDAKDKKVYVFGFGPMIYEGLLSIFADKDYGDVTLIDTGRDIKLTKAGEGRDTQYTVLPAGKESPVLNWEKKKENLVDLDAIVESDLLPYKKLKALLEGVESGDSAEEEDEDEDEKDEEEDDEEKEVKSSKKKSKEDDEESEDEDEDDEKGSKDDEDEDEDEPKASKKKSKEDDEESEDEDEDEDEPKASKKKSKGDEDEDEDGEEKEGEPEDEDDDGPKKSKKGDDDDDEEAEKALERLANIRKSAGKKK